jgi:threonine dehydrogenase-like Zn-dependent dehydrogenase
MRALVWDGVTATVQDRAPPSLATLRESEGDEPLAVVRVRCAGICNTDLEITRGYLGFRGVLGHELVGVVEEAPPGHDAWRGRRVVAEINFACGRCSTCAVGLRRHCPTRTVMGIVGADGALAELVRVPIANLHAVPEAVGDDRAVFAEPLAAAFEVLEQLHVEPGTRAVVLGDGKLGLLVAQVLHQAGAETMCVGRHADKLELLERRGVRTIRASDWEPASERADLVVEATGSAQGLALAVAATRPRGTVVLKSTVAPSASGPGAELLAQIVIHEIRVVGSRCGSFAPALRALSTGSVDVSALVSRRFDLEHAADALRAAAQPGVLKVLVEASS